MLYIFNFPQPPEEGEPFVYNKKAVTQLIYKKMGKHTAALEDYPYNTKVTVYCSEALFKRVCPNVNWAGHDAWRKLMEKVSIPYSHDGPAFLSVNWSERTDMCPDQIALEVDADGETIYTELIGPTMGGTTTVLQDESVNKYYRRGSVPYARKCTDHSMELWVKPLGSPSRIDKNEVVSLHLSILGGDAECWEETLDKNNYVFSSQNKFIIGGSNALPDPNLLRLHTDTVSDRHLEGRRRKGYWEIRPIEGSVYMDDQLLSPDSGWVRLEDSSVITLNETTIKIDFDG